MRVSKNIISTAPLRRAVIRLLNFASLAALLAAANGFCGSPPAPFLPVPPSHPVYDLLERLETRQMITFHSSLKPLSRGEITQSLLIIREIADSGEGFLSRREIQDLRRFLREFNVEGDYPPSNIARLREKLWDKAPVYRDGLNLFQHRGTGYSIEVNPLLYWDFLADSSGETISRRTSGLHLEAGLGEHFGCSFDFRDTQEGGRGPYNTGERYKLYQDRAAYITLDGDDVCYYDITRATISAGWNRLWLNFGRGDNRWGPGRFGALMLSDNPPPFDFLSARYDIADFLRFAYLMGSLHPYPEVYSSIDTTISGQERRIIAGKYLAAHRLEIYPCRGVEIGLAESVIYGERGLEPAYLNPLNLYFSAEHNLGDMDNVAWSGDAKLNLIPGITFYGELFIDDMKTRELGTSYYSNKFAWTTGAFIVDPLKFRNSDFTIEYSRIEPFVYTHFYSINVYKNWNSSLGHFLPPNSECLFLRAGWKPFYTVSGTVSAAFLRHGRNTAELNAGGDIDTPVEPNHTQTPFMAGEEFTSTVYELRMKWEPLEYYYLEGKVRNHRWSGGESNEWQVTFGVNVW